MKVALAYVYVPTEPYYTQARRFTESLEKHSAGHPYELHASSTTGLLPSGLAHLTTRTHHYRGNGRDVGAHQFMANRIDCDLLVCCTSSIYFHRAGWLKRLVEAREKHGEGLYGNCGSAEVYPHIRTDLYALSPEMFRLYPMKVNDDKDRYHFEHGFESLTRWMIWNRALPCLTVHWEGESGVFPDGIPNGFRDGDQSNCLAYGKYHDLYRDASPEQKRIYERLKRGEQV